HVLHELLVCSFFCRHTFCPLDDRPGQSGSLLFIQESRGSWSMACADGDRFLPDLILPASRAKLALALSAPMEGSAFKLATRNSWLVPESPNNLVKIGWKAARPAGSGRIATDSTSVTRLAGFFSVEFQSVSGLPSALRRAA